MTRFLFPFPSGVSSDAYSSVLSDPADVLPGASSSPVLGFFVVGSVLLVFFVALAAYADRDRT